HRHRHVADPDDRYDGGRHRAAIDHQPHGRRRSGADPDGRWRHRRAVRHPRRRLRTRRPAARHACAACPRRRHALPRRPRPHAGRAVLAGDTHGRHAMKRIAILAWLAMLWLGMSPARAEQLIVALSAEEVRITSNFTGTSITVFGAIERDAATVSRAEFYDVVVAVKGPPETVVTRQ